MPRHHILPQMILRRFATTKELITMHSREGIRSPFQLAVRKACSEVGFYEIPKADVADCHQEGHEPEIVESVLSGIEGAANAIITEILDGSFPISGEKRFRLAFYLALQMSRGWSFRESINQTAQNILILHLEATMTDEWLADSIQKDGGRPSQRSIEDRRREILRNPPRIEVGKSTAIQQSLDVGMNELLPHIYLRSWRILKFKDPCLLTSDNPFGYWAPIDRRKDGPFGVGDAPAVFFPLDRSTALSMTLRRAEEQIVPSGQTRARQINYCVAVEAEKWIMHHPADAPLNGIEMPPKGRIVREFVGSRIDADGNYRELHRVVKR